MYRIGDSEIEAVRRVIESGKLFRTGCAADGHQGAVDQFEMNWARTIGTDYSLLLSGGGTAALICALAALGIGPGDEVIVPAYTWMATATAVLSVGAIPVLTEIDATLTLDPYDVACRISPHTRAIIPVHVMGRSADLNSLQEIASQHGLYIIEDCAQACGGSYRGRRLGCFGDAGCFSFNDFKILSCGEGGAMVTHDRTLYDRARIFHDSLNGFKCFADDLTVEPFVGLQFRASEIMGAIMGAQLNRLDGILADLRRIADQFGEGLADVLSPAPSNDADGDCRMVMTYQFPSAAEAIAFARSPGVNGTRPIETHRHIFTNWDAILQGRTSHHPDWDALRHDKNQSLQSFYTPEQCPRTLDWAERSVFVKLNPDWTEAEAENAVAACRSAFS